MAGLSRRQFVGSTMGSALAAAVLPVTVPAHAATRQGGRLRVQFAPGGHTSPLQMYSMFESPLFQDMDTVVLPHPDAFDAVGTPEAPHVIVTNDWITGQWPKKEQDNMRRHVEAGGGVVVLHHAVGSNNGTTSAPGWTWWSEEVMGCYLYNPNVPGVKTAARLKQFPIQTITAAGSHPIVRGIEPFQLPWDETFPNMWISPKATVLLTSDDPSFNNPAVAWVGPPLPRGRCVCIQPGHTAIVCQDPTYRQIVHNAILWASGRQS